METLIVANWKCHPTTLKEAEDLFNSIKQGIKKIKGVEVVICPPFVYLPLMDPGRSLNLGAQDCFWEKKGPYTSGISPLMLKDLGCRYVILGHSERRKYFKDSDQIVNKKLRGALKQKLNPILCVGETKTQKEKGNTQKVIKQQIERGLKKVSEPQIKQVVVGYEPRWAIGSGKPCSPEEVRVVNLLIRKAISKLYDKNISNELKILYGGSVDSKKALSYTEEAEVQGLLVGSASLKPQEFTKIVKKTQEG